MYSRPYKSQSSGAVRAFEDAYAKEEFLRRTAVMGKESRECVPQADVHRNSVEHFKDNSVSDSGPEHISEKTPPNTFRNPKNSFSGLFGDADGGDMLILFLIALFLTDKDAENDRIIPILLAVLLFF